MLKFPKAQISGYPVHLFNSIRLPRDFTHPLNRRKIDRLTGRASAASRLASSNLLSCPPLPARITVAPLGRETDTRGSGCETVVISSSSTDGRRLRAGNRKAAPRLHGRNVACARCVNESAPRLPPPPPPPSPSPLPPPPRNSHAGDTRAS